LITVGIDWAEDHHDVTVMDDQGQLLARQRIPEGLDGVTRLHALLADHATTPDQVLIGIETDRGLLVGALLAAGYQVFAINPKAVDRYRERHAQAGAKSDGGDAKVLADLVRTDRHNHRRVAGDSDLAEAVKILARAHHNLIWTRQRLCNQLRSALREYYPAALAAFGADLAHPDALAVLTAAPTPTARARPLRSTSSSTCWPAPAASATSTRAPRPSVTPCTHPTWPHPPRSLTSTLPAWPPWSASSPP
jgi:transposase